MVVSVPGSYLLLFGPHIEVGLKIFHGLVRDAAFGVFVVFLLFDGCVDDAFGIEVQIGREGAPDKSGGRQVFVLAVVQDGVDVFKEPIVSVVGPEDGLVGVVFDADFEGCLKPCLFSFLFPRVEAYGAAKGVAVQKGFVAYEAEAVTVEAGLGFYCVLTFVIPVVFFGEKKELHARWACIPNGFFVTAKKDFFGEGSTYGGGVVRHPKARLLRG